MIPGVGIFRGCNIVALVVSVVGAMLGIAFVVMMFSASSLLHDPDYFQSFVSELQSSSFSGSEAFDGESAVSAYDYSSMSEEELQAAANLGMNIVIGLAVFYLAVQVVGVVACVLSLRALSDPINRLRTAFIWTVIAALGSAITIFTVYAVVTCLCFIVSAVTNRRMRKYFDYVNQYGTPDFGMPGYMSSRMPYQDQNQNQGNSDDASRYELPHGDESGHDTQEQSQNNDSQKSDSSRKS